MSGETTPFVDWLAGRLKRAGMRYAFGVPGGGSSLDLMQALFDQGIKPVVTAREDAAVIMAGISGVLSNGPGMAFTTKGPGLASATNGLASAALDRLPMLLVSETFSEKELVFLSHQVFAQTELVGPLLRQGQGKELAPSQDAIMDWLSQTTPTPAVMFPSLSDLTAQVPIDADASAIKSAQRPDFFNAEKILNEAESPVIVLGLETIRSSCTAELREFVRSLGAPVLCTYMAKGAVPDDDPHFAGLFTGGAIEQPCMNTADLIILIGLDPVELIRKPWIYSAPVLDLCERVYDPHYLTPDERVVAPLSRTLQSLAKSITASAWKPESIADFRSNFLNRMEEGSASGMSSVSVVKAIRDSFAERPRLAVDAGAHMFSACAFWPVTAPNELLISNGLASMGFAVPAAIAAALYDPKRGAIAITGDGGFLMCLGELKTAVENDVNILIVVFNDGRLSLIDIKREDRQMPNLGLDWTPPDFATVSAGFGFQSWQVNKTSELIPILNTAASANGPRLIDVKVDARGYRKQLEVLRG